ncbi:Cytidylate kinase [Jeotgalibaca dankookensis]|uniref:Cytidylate kinase n=1 Tax=Jeotgalibaca dankookensis TaxID=708126 RepID=A0A1S6INC2_9LACT|nr:(d)CMP kinase [Jeotgalibaca dankookensis]AQS53047.1 Cytidylate kinase [Jeotgalibaca dankookensis]
MEQFNIAIDGPASAGKSTIAKQVAKELGLTYLDTGAMYRALTYMALVHKLNLEDETALLNLLADTEISFPSNQGMQHVFINKMEVTEVIRSKEVTQNVSLVSSHKNVRKKMVSRQQKIAQQGGIVMDGRDIGTVVLPNAALKIYLVASAEERALRRYRESIEKGMQVSLEELTADMIARDNYDMNREASPLKKAEDAIEIDSTNLSINQVVEMILDYAKNYQKKVK